jgi:hypothetical protein
MVAKANTLYVLGDDLAVDHGPVPSYRVARASPDSIIEHRGPYACPFTGARLIVLDVVHHEGSELHSEAVRENYPLKLGLVLGVDGGPWWVQPRRQTLTNRSTGGPARSAMQGSVPVHYHRSPSIPSLLVGDSRLGAGPVFFASSVDAFFIPLS